MDKRKFEFNYLCLLKQVEKNNIQRKRNCIQYFTEEYPEPKGEKERISEISTWKVCYIQNSEDSKLKELNTRATSRRRLQTCIKYATGTRYRRCLFYKKK
jgi:hypothetical protein